MSWATALPAAARKHKPPHGGLGLAVREIIAHAWFSDSLSALKDRYPDVKNDTTIDISPRLSDGLKTGDCDTVLVGAHPIAGTCPALDLATSRFVSVGRGEGKGKARIPAPEDLPSRRIIA